MPLTADERERRYVQYLLACNKGEIAEIRLGRMNRVANFRKAVRELIDAFVEAKAEEIAAAMLEQYAPERPQVVEMAKAAKRGAKMRRIPTWVQRAGSAQMDVGKKRLTG